MLHLTCRNDKYEMKISVVMTTYGTFEMIQRYIKKYNLKNGNCMKMILIWDGKRVA